MTPINYERIGKAIKDYAWEGYEYIEVPWIVSRKSIDVTLPEDHQPHRVVMWGKNKQNECLVGSAEQSFLEIRDRLCPNRQYQTVTPCFRDDQQDFYHSRWFMKLELIWVVWKEDDPLPLLDRMISHAVKFMRQYGPITKEKTEIGFDLKMHDIELGSYGIRFHNDFRWIYGTGLAEPRMSQAIKLNEEHSRKQDEEELRSIQ
jgi:hypothetical protein